MKFLAAIAALTLLPALHAQMHHVDAPERVTRAVGVYEWTGDLKKPDAARLVPLTVFINGRVENAGTYLAQPVPFALGIGVVYSVEKAGDPFGTLELNLARDVAVQHRTVDGVVDDSPAGNWYGYGNFAPPAPPKKSKPLKPSVNLASVSGTDDDERPHFVAPRSATDSAPATATPATPTTGAVPDDDPDRPTLGHRDDTASATKEKKPKKEKPGGYVTPTATSLNDDPDRPTIRRGQAVADAVPQLTGMPLAVHQAVAVSDPATHELHLFTRDWDTADERATTLAAMEALATPRVQQYLSANGLNVAQAQPPRTSRSTAHAAKPAPPAPPAFHDEQLQGYQLSYGGLPTFVYSAQVAAPSNATTVVYVTLVAQRLPSGELQTSLTGLTDSAHLDRAPWLRFIDVVDADGSHRASLVFELRAAHSRQFALYRLVTAAAEQTFLSNILE